jgi:hypothetical protein
MVVIQAATIVHNDHAGNVGGAIHSSNCVLNVTEGSTIVTNTACNNAGAVALTLLSNGTFSGIGTSCSNNITGGHGGYWFFDSIWHPPFSYCSLSGGISQMLLAFE